MPRIPFSFLPILLSFAVVSPAQAAPEEQEAWSPIGSTLRANAAGIVLPQTIGALSLSKSGEASNGGKGVDNYAQYLSDDGTIQATLYVYMPSYADASLAAHMTDRAIMERFGTMTRRTAYATIPVAGRSDGAIRAVYDDAADGSLITTAAFVHVGRWIVKLRVTGPTERRNEVIVGLDRMLNALAFDDPRTVRGTAVANFGACHDGDGGGNTSPTVWVDEAGRSLCVRGRINTGSGSYDMLQQSGERNGAIVVPIDDAGTVLALDPAQGGKGYQLSIHSIGQTNVYGIYDDVPSDQQIAAILEGKDPMTARAKTTREYAASGGVIVRTDSK